MSKPTGWVETPCLIASVPSSGQGLSYPVNQTEEQSEEHVEAFKAANRGREHGQNSAAFKDVFKQLEN
ncbi:hypothetical protein ACLOJK_026859, partial [Asimina triloba]